MTQLLSTGIGILDTELEGGIPPGSIIALTAPPASQSELLLQELSTTRETLYLTLQRPGTQITNIIEQSTGTRKGIEVIEIEPTDALSFAEEIDVASSSNIIIDPFTPLERSESLSVREFLNTLRPKLTVSDSIAFLHCIEGRSVPEQRDTTEYMADSVFTLSSEFEEGELETRLGVPKFRGRKALDETIKLDMTKEIEVDISRNIA